MSPSPIRVLTILEAYSVTGPAKAVLEVFRESKLAQHPRIELTILTFVRASEDNEFTRRVRAEGIPLEIVRERGRFDLGLFPQLREVIARRQPHIIWTHAVKSHFLIRAAGLNRSAKWVAFDHGYTTTSMMVRMYNELDRWSLHGADRIVTVCQPFADRLVSRGIPRDLIRVEHMPIRPSAEFSADAGAALRRKLQIDSAAIVLLTVGRLSAEKGHAELLQAVARIRTQKPDLPLLLLIVGDGPEAARLRELASGLHLENAVRFMGHQAEVRDFYRMADIFVLPSHSEGSPNVILEAIDGRTPIVASAVGGIPEMVSDEESALLVPPRDVPALTAAITRIIADPSLGARLKTAAMDVLARHSPEHYFRSIAALFEEITSSR